jgi:hypothetical protein
MAEVKVFNRRAETKGGGVVRVELWQDSHTKQICRYAMAYVNAQICHADHGRVVGFDNAHCYEGHPTRHHRHWMGGITHNRTFTSVEQLNLRFQRLLRWLKRRHQKRY